MNNKERFLLGMIVLLIAMVVGFWVFWPRPSVQTQGDGTATGEQLAEVSRPSPLRGLGANDVASGGPSAPPARPAVSELQKAYLGALQLRDQNKLIEARDAISAVLFAGGLDRHSETEALRVATELAGDTILSGIAYAGDPYCDYYLVKFGDRLGGVVEQLKLRVPYQMIMAINGITDARTLQAGKRIKVIRGPFHAIITKHTFTLDLYLHRQGLPKTFISRLYVGLGKDDLTPEGMWRVASGEKLIRPVWYPSPNNRNKGPIPYGDPNYAFGAKGLWIGLAGADENTRLLSDYGIHSTNDPGSIGQCRSDGCIRLADADIELVFSALCEDYSTVEVRP